MQVRFINKLSVKQKILWLLLITADIVCLLYLKNIWTPVLKQMFDSNGRIAVTVQNIAIMSFAILAFLSILQLNAISSAIYGLYFTQGEYINKFINNMIITQTGFGKSVYIDYISTILTFMIFAVVAGFFNVYFAKGLSGLIFRIEPAQQIQQRHVKDLVRNKDIFNQLVGVDEAINTIIDALKLPLMYPEKAKKFGVKPLKGVLLYGPPGCGKTSIARAIAEYFNCPFYSVKAGELLGMYVGTTENNIKNLFAQARANTPSIIFIDEIDHIGKKRTNSDLNTPSELVLQPLLAEMDGFQENDRVVVIAATNRPDILDEALLRPGRFDKLIEIPLPDKDGRKALFTHYLMGKPIRDGIDYNLLAELTEGFAPAHISEICNEAALKALKREISGDKNSVIMQDDLLDGIKRQNQAMSKTK